MSVVSDSPLLVVAAAGAGAQAAPVATAAGRPGEDQSFARVLQSERMGAAAGGVPPTAGSGENLPTGGNGLPPTAAARAVSPSLAAAHAASTATQREGGLAWRASLESAGGGLLLNAAGAAAAKVAAGDAVTGLSEQDVAALASGEALYLTAESALALAEEAGARTRSPQNLLPRLIDGAAEVAAVEIDITGDSALPAPSVLSAAVAAATVSGAAAERPSPAPLSPLQLSAARGRPSGEPALLNPLPSADGEALTRSGVPLPEALAFDPGATQRAAAALQGTDGAARLGRADEGLRQLMAGVSLDRAGGTQQLEQALTAQATSAGNTETESALLAATLQRGSGDDARQVGRANESAALIAGAGASAQPVNGPDQPGRPAALLNLLATPSDPEFAPEFAGRLQMMVKNGMREANVQLHPAELGRLQLTISTDGDQARIVIVAETAAARDMIEQSMPRLRDMLEQSGLQLAQGDVSQRQRDMGDGSPGAGSVPGSLSEASGEPEAAGGMSIGLATSDRLLDAYV